MQLKGSSDGNWVEMPSVRSTVHGEAMIADILGVSVGYPKQKLHGEAGTKYPVFFELPVCNLLG